MADDLLDAIDEFLDDSIVLPPGDWDENLLLPVMHQRNEMRKRKGEGGRERMEWKGEFMILSSFSESKQMEHEQRKMFAIDPLRHSRRLCGGIWADLKRLVKRYPSDIRDMFHFQVCGLSPSITVPLLHQ